MSNILLLGGTKFFGIRLVEKMIAHGHDVTIISRAKKPSALFHDKVTYINEELNFSDNITFNKQLPRITPLIENRNIDVLIDNISQQGNHIEKITELLTNTNKPIRQYVLCSSVAVYNNWNKGFSASDWPSHALIEEEADINQQGYCPSIFSPTFSQFYEPYANGKRSAESALSRLSAEKKFSYTIMRPTVIEGFNDPHHRTWYWVQRLLDNQPILIPHTTANTIYRHVYVDDVAEAFFNAIENPLALNQTFNIAGEEILTVREHLLYIADALNRERSKVKLISADPKIITEKISGFEFPPFFFGAALVSDISKIKKHLNYKPQSISHWMPITVEKLLEMKKQLPDSLGYQNRREEVLFADSIIT